MSKYFIPSVFFILISSVCLAVCPFQLEGDVNEDCRVDLLDVVAMASNWLVDCNIDPTNPACDATQAMIDQQEDQFRYIKDALELYRDEFGDYPPSNDNADVINPHPYDPTPYSGANKLAEALVGLDRLGFHPNSAFRSDGVNIRDDGTGTSSMEDYPVYHTDIDDYNGNGELVESGEDNLQNRKGPFIDAGVANVFAMQDVYQNTGGFRTAPSAPGIIEQSLVLCDVFEKLRLTSEVTGMPILYYRARDFFSQQDSQDILEIQDDIYYYPDNENILALGVAENQTGPAQPLYENGGSMLDYLTFENMILDPSVTVLKRPYRPDGYILISAGPDGLYGTGDDLFDFELLEDEPLPTESSKEDQQEDQFRYIKDALELYRDEFGDYPPSNDNADLINPHPDDPTPYSGANKLAEALVGLDRLGFHPNSAFRSDGVNIRDDGTGTSSMEDYPVYHTDIDDYNGNGELVESGEDNLQNRKGPFIDAGVANVFAMQDVYQNTGGFRTAPSAPGIIEQSLVLCDVFEKPHLTSEVTGMPILYYRARDFFTRQDSQDILEIQDDIYYYPDNENILALGVAEDQTGPAQPLYENGGNIFDYLTFESMIIDPSVTAIKRPYRPDGYILISAGPDGLYGTSDDLFDFELLEDEPLPAPVSKEIMQRSQFAAIDVALEMYRMEFGDYPPSNDNDDLYDPVNNHLYDPTPYGGANKLAEALAGLDMLGVHPNTDFRSDGNNMRDDGAGSGQLEEYAVYHVNFDDLGNAMGQYAETAVENFLARKGPFIDTQVANVFNMQDVYGDVQNFRIFHAVPSEIDRSLVLCDVFEKRRNTGKLTGMPVLYYKARTYAQQDVTDPGEISDDIYYYPDNWNLLNLGTSFGFGYNYYPDQHPLNDPMPEGFINFEQMILNPNITVIKRPYRADSYILISAGEDGLYGTSDDITNFDE
ncbi:MAG: hypothetical protein KAJ07_09295 [Planctomycetes bacterium]|nr:hypothetical protein [Planctomycetota bacterium]